MASRVGTRPTGSDGTDFLHRERVAGHYEASVANKSRLRYTIYLHLMLVMLMMFRLCESFFLIMNLQPPQFLQELKLPRAEFWEFIWLTSSIASLFGLIALRKNRAVLVQQYIIGTLIFGLGPVVYAIFATLDDLLAYYEMRETKNLFLGFPVVVMWNMFLVIALQVHAFGLWFGWNLLCAWKARGETKKLS
jgi:hypothetical protein